MPGLPAPPDTSRLSRVELENLPAGLRHPDPATLEQYEAVRLFIARAVAVRPDFARHQRERAGRGGHLRPPPRHAARHRARRRPREAPRAGADPRPPRAAAGPPDLDRPRPARPPADAAGRDRLELRPARRAAAPRCSPASRSFGGGWDLEAAEAVGRCGRRAGHRRPRRAGRARRPEPRPQCRGSRGAALRHVRDDPRVRRGAARRGRRRRRHPGAPRPRLPGPGRAPAPLLQGAEQRAWLDRLERDHDNLRAALSWATGRPDPETAVRLCFALWRFWQQRGYLVEARSELDGIAAQAWDLPAPLRARFAETLGGVAYWQADLPVSTARWTTRRSRSGGSVPPAAIPPTGASSRTRSTTGPSSRWPT